MSKVRVLYDFTAESTSEVSTYTGEELVVLDPTSYEGWLKIRNSRGEEGIVPAAYVENIDDDDIPPPPASTMTIPDSWAASTPTDNAPSYINSPPYDQTSAYINNNYNNQENDVIETSNNNDNTNNRDSLNTDPLAELEAVTTAYIETITPGIEEPIEPWGGAVNTAYDYSSEGNQDKLASYNDNESVISPYENTNPTPQVPYVQPVGNVSASSWDSVATAPATTQNQFTASKPITSHYSDSDDFDDEDQPPSAMCQQQVVNRSNNGSFSVADRSSTLSTTAAASSSTGVLTKHKNKNSFGLDVFLLCGAVKAVPESDRISTIVLNDQRLSLWKRRCPPYQIAIINHVIDKKYNGLKTFVCYEIQTEKFPQKVKRRYNQFVWLHERLEEKYPNICVPPLPDKAVRGNFNDDFIMSRKAKLELWLNRLSSHPVIGESEVFVHFLQCDAASAKWTAGKRKAEKDEYRGSQWFATLSVPNESPDTIPSIKDRLDKFSKASYTLDYTVKNTCSALEKVMTMHCSAYKKELTVLGKRFEECGTALSNESLDAQNNNILSRAMVTCGNTYNQIANSYAEQPKEDIVPLLDRLQLYRGIIQQMPDIVQFEKNAIQTCEEFQQKPEKLQGRNIMEVTPRREIISHVTFAEINQFNKDKVEDITVCMKTFLKKQIDFYSEITECLKRSLAGFEQIPVSKKF